VEAKKADVEAKKADVEAKNNNEGINKGLVTRTKIKKKGISKCINWLCLCKKALSANA
jgi:hypothetical protein